MAKKGDGGPLDLETHFAFYGAYHSNQSNIIIHTLFVWPILFSSLMLLRYFPPLLDVGAFPCGLPVDVGFFVTLFYAGFYVLLDKKAGSLGAFLCFACWVAAGLLSDKLGPSLAWKVAVAAQLFCWTGQFLGHGVFEGRAPALFDNLAQAFLTAPFFVLLEVLQTTFGYEPYPGFHASVKAKTEAEVKKCQDQKEKKSS